MYANSFILSMEIFRANNSLIKKLKSERNLPISCSAYSCQTFCFIWQWCSNWAPRIRRRIRRCPMEQQFVYAVFLSQEKLQLTCVAKDKWHLSRLSIPHLKLYVAELLSKLVTKVFNSLKLNTQNVYLRSDSTTVLGRIQTNPYILKTFVGNRIKELTGCYSCRHTKSENNSADLVSRGLCPERISKRNLWWCGPVILQ